MDYEERAERVKLLDVGHIEHYDLSFGESSRGVSVVGTMESLDWFNETYVKRSDVY